MCSQNPETENEIHARGEVQTILFCFSMAQRALNCVKVSLCKQKQIIPVECTAACQLYVFRWPPPRCHVGAPYHVTYPLVHLMLSTPPSPREQTDACENSTFPKLRRLLALINLSIVLRLFPYAYGGL